MSINHQVSKDVHVKVLSLMEVIPEIDVLWLYGSRAKGTADECSDYDFAIAVNSDFVRSSSEPLHDELVYRLSGDTNQMFSVIDINQAPVPLCYNVINEGVVMFCRSSLRLHAEQMRVWSLWENYRYEFNKNRA